MDNADIFDAASAGDLETVTYLVNTKKIDVNSKVADGGTPLMRASAYGHFGVIKFLIQKGANVNHTDRWGYTALLWAVDKHVAGLHVIKYLVERKANINVKDKLKGYSPLHWVVEHGDLEMVKYLLAKGARFDDTTKQGETPLDLAAIHNRINVLQYFIDERKARFDIFEAAEKGYLKAVKYFIVQRKKPINADDQNGWTALHRAAYGGHLETVEYLVGVKDANINAANTRRKTPATPLHAAVEKGHVEIVRYLINHGAEAKTRDANGRTALYWACRNGHLDLVEYFIDTLKGSAHDTDNFGQTLLHASCWTRNLEVVRYLLDEKHLDVNAQDNEGHSPLIQCIEQANANVTDYLLGRTNPSVNVKLVDKNGNNAIHYAAAKNYLTIVKELISRGGEYQALNRKNQTPLDFASLGGHLAAVKYFIDDLGVSYKGNVFSAAEKGYLGLLRYLVEVKTSRVDVTDATGLTPLHRASTANQMEVVKYLVEKERVNVNAKHARNGVPYTALHAASQNGHIRIVKYLAEQKADLMTRDGTGRTPLYWAATSGFLDIVKYFVDVKKVNINQRDNFGSPLLHTAAMNGNLEVVKYLLKEKKVDVNEKDNNGHTVLFRAGFPRLADMFRYLLDEGGANFRITDKGGKTCLHVVAEKAYIDIVRMLVEKGADINARDSESNTPVYFAAFGSDGDGEKESDTHLNVLKYFLDERKADIRQRAVFGRTLLHAAVRSGHLDAVKYLVEEKGMDVNETDSNRVTPIFDAIFTDNREIFRYLLDERSADFRISLADTNGTLLHLAGRKGYFDVVKILVDKGADINAKDTTGETPVFYTAGGGDVVDEVEDEEEGHLNSLRYFLDVKKANPFQRGQFNKTLLHVAVKSTHMNVVKYLVEEKKLDINAKDGDGKTVLFDSISAGRVDIFRYLLEEKNADFRAPNNKNETCLHEAAQKGFLDIVKALTKKGADINAKDENGRTPVSFSASGENQSEGGGHLNILQYFLEELNADPFQKDNNSDTLLHWGEWNGALDVVKYLVEEKGLDVNAKNDLGNTPLAECYDRGEVEVCKYLVSKGAVKSRRRRNVQRTSSVTDVAPATNSAPTPYSLINCVAYYSKNIASNLLSSSAGSLDGRIIGSAAKPAFSSHLLNDLLMLMNVGYGKFFRSEKEYASLYPPSENLLSPSQLIERRFDLNATIAVHDSFNFSEG